MIIHLLSKGNMKSKKLNIKKCFGSIYKSLLTIRITQTISDHENVRNKGFKDFLRFGLAVKNP